MPLGFGFFAWPVIEVYSKDLWRAPLSSKRKPDANAVPTSLVRGSFSNASAASLRLSLQSR